MLKILFKLIVLFILSGSCKNSSTANDKPHESNNPYIDAIKNSATADNPDDSSHLARILILEQDYNFGTLSLKDTFHHDFKFINTGNARLLISSVSGTCGCTSADYPKGFILPSDTGIIKVRFVPEKTGDQEKPITITANTRPNKTVIQFKGKVLSKN